MVFGILIALALFIFMALRGASIILAAIVCSLIVAVTNGIDLDKAIFEYFPFGKLGAFTFAGKFFLLFVAGAIFGKINGASGAATSIAKSLIHLLGKQNVLLITVIASAVLTYGGVVVFVVIFAMYPLGLKLLQECNVPKRLFVAALALGIGTFTMTALPGSPSIHNIISSVSLETDLFAAWEFGLLASFIMFTCGVAYLNWAYKKAKEKGESFQPSERDLQILNENDHEQLPHWFTAILPIASVILIILLPRLMESMGHSFGWVQYAKSQPLLWPSIALFIGVILSYVLFPVIRSKMIELVGKGSDDAIFPLIATSVVIGFGGVVTQTEAFAQFNYWITHLDLPNTFSAYLSATSVSAIVGSGSGGLQIFMATMAEHYINLGMDREILHRIATIASGGLDSLPHCGAVVALLSITGLTHKQGYKDIAVVTVAIPVFAGLITVTSIGVLV